MASLIFYHVATFPLQKRFNVDDVEEPTHQVGNLLESRLYHVTVSATTKVGESRPSPILSASPAAKSNVFRMDYV